jgi:hypothetical protein
VVFLVPEIVPSVNVFFESYLHRNIVLGFIFYTYNGIIGKSPDFINISIFFISAAIAYIYETKCFRNKKIFCSSPKLSFITLCVIALLFLVFTFKTPEIAIFKDPLTGTYGIPK